MKRTILTVALATLTSAAFAQFNLADYGLSATVSYAALPDNDELSGVTYNWDNGRLYAVEDEGLRIFEFDKFGNYLSSMQLLNAGTDPEGITYIGGGEFLVAEERIQDMYRISYTAGGSLNRAGLPTFSVGATVGNVGLEGISYDPISGSVFGVKEKTPQAIYTIAGLDFPTMTGGVVGSIASSLGLLDLSDVQNLSTVPSLIGTGDQNNLLILSQESNLLLEVDSSGTILSQFDLSGFGSGSIEGVTIDENGTIYLVSEDPKMFILNVPEPSAFALMALGGALLAGARRRIQG
jgi:uncharacterized protein YjiK